MIRRRLEEEIAAATDCLARMQVLPSAGAQLADAFDRARLRTGGGSEFIQDADTVNARLDDVVESAQFEILAAQPGGPRTEEQLNRSLARDTHALQRGVVKKTLYLATVRDNSVTAKYVRATTGGTAGQQAQFRTMTGVFERAIVVDRRIAFISNRIVAGAPANSAWQVTDPAFVGYIIGEFEARWERADPWHGESRGQLVDTVSGPGPGGVRTTARQREILRVVVAGRSQQATAQRLGVSLRTLGVEIAELKSLFDAASLPEVTYKWALSPDRMVDDSAGEDALPVAA